MVAFRFALKTIEARTSDSTDPIQSCRCWTHKTIHSDHNRLLMSHLNTIRLRNVRVNNLQNVDLEIPHGQWVSFCGMSGSGKSSLAFDTLYAEGQRRYIESLSPQTRQFIHQLEKPAADLIEGIPPAIAVKAFRGKVQRKTTVGTATEISEYLRLMFAQIGQVECPNCQIAVKRNDPQMVAQRLFELPEGRRYQVAFRPVETVGDDGREFPPLQVSVAMAQKNGFVRAIVGEQTIDLSGSAAFSSGGLGLHKASPSDECYVVVDRLKSGASEISRIRESVEIAFQFGLGICKVFISADSNDENSGSESEQPTVQVDGKPWLVETYSRQLNCPQCSTSFPDPEPRLFNFKNKLGACEECEGLGFVDSFDIEVCESCRGQRLNQLSLAFKIAGQSLGELSHLRIEDVFGFFQSLQLQGSEKEITRQILPQIVSRLSCLCEVGLPYLHLDRPLRSLSAGEAQRVSLTSCLSSTLVNMLYVLDEPSVGLHAHDVGNLTSAIKRLHERGNTIVVVDHEEKVIGAADRIVEIGPEAGVEGGEVVFDGTLDQIGDCEQSITGDFIAGRRGAAGSAENRRQPRGAVRLTGATGNNLKNIDVEFPLGCLCVVTGVSGAGKSSLVQQTLYGAICQRKDQTCAVPPLPYTDLFGDSQFDEVVLVDQSPIGRSPRSNPVTYVKAFDDIRKTYAETLDAKTNNIKMGQFSFNVGTGRCEKCEGDGQLTVDMQFMSDIYVTCSQCRGTRYREEILAVKYRGQSIAETLNLTVRQAFTFFRGQPKVQGKLKSLMDVGLGYIRLGQPANTLSSGEAQRLKLGHYLNASRSKRALFILDEPTTGLHMRDVVRLYDCFETLLSVGHSLIVVEHNLQLISYADWVIDLGPGAADEGGMVVATGTPEMVARNEDSVTGQYLNLEVETQ